MKKKVNNKGFSLVEIIVVVLIIAIISVALVPQVMRWVENSRIADDLEVRTSIEKACQIAITEEDVFKEVEDGDHVIYITKDSTGTSVYGMIGGVIDETGLFWNSVSKVAGFADWQEFKDSIKLQSNPINAPQIELTVYVYVNGHTFSTLTGFASAEIDG